MAKVIGKEESTEVMSSEQYTKDNQSQKLIVTDSAEAVNSPTAIFNIQIQAIFKRTPPEYATTTTILRRGPMTWIMPAKSLECRCPKIKINKSYLILGKDSEAQPGYLGIGTRSIVIEWKDEWYRRMKRFQRRARTCV